MHIGLIPLDERPVNTRYPEMIAQIGGATLHLPPREMLSVYHQPARCDDLLRWLERNCTPSRCADRLIPDPGLRRADRFTHQPGTSFEHTRAARVPRQDQAALSPTCLSSVST